MSEYEFRRYQTTYPLFTPLRGAGHYWDHETDMFENHNRYYEAATGRYLSPEPMLQYPDFDTSSGVIKIPDTCRCDIICAPGGGYGGLACSCWPFPKRDTEYIPATTRKEWGWPENPWLSYSGSK